MKFSAIWWQGIPIIINGVEMPQFDPEYFISNFGDAKVEIEDCGTEVRKRVRVGDYLFDFGTTYRDGSGPILKLKVGIEFIYFHVAGAFR